MLDEKAKNAGITILGEMGLDPGIGILLHKKIVVILANYYSFLVLYVSQNLNIELHRVIHY